MAYSYAADAHKSLFFGQFAEHAESQPRQSRYRIYKRTIRALERLSDRQLRDIGIPRSEIRQHAYQCTYGN